VPVGKLVVLFFFVVAVVVFTLVKYAARGVKAGYSYVNERERLASEVLQRRQLLSPASIQQPLRDLDGGPSPAQQNRALLERFAARLRQQGLGPFSFDEPGIAEQICGLLAGQFAKAVNGKTLVPSSPFSGNDLAVAWIGKVAADVATQATGTDFALASMAMPIPLTDTARIAANPEKIAGEMVDLEMAAGRIHNRLVITQQADDIFALIAKSFQDWALEGRDAGVFALRRSLPKIAANIAAATAA
jgi:hypothetical protein